MRGDRLMDGQRTTETTGYFDRDAADLETFAALTARALMAADVPQAAEIHENIPVYDAAALAPALEDPVSRRALMAEWARCLKDTSGVLVLAGAYADTSIIDRATDVFTRIIADERAATGGGADHFAAAGANDRIWNALQKLGMADPQTFVRYQANVAIDAVCEAWLGPGYQMTAQVNLVRPGGAAQQPHRDYHLGFMTTERAASYPAHVHDLSPVLTLQGGIAHCDMPVESGPTRLLPFSQLFRAGYLAFGREDFRAHFDAHAVQLPLAKGDAIFFNPALYHGAGENRSADIQRMANLLQISSPMGRAMETVDRLGLTKTIFPALRNAVANGELNDAEAAAVIASTAEGYSFPTNLDTDPPIGGLAPKTQADVLREALRDGWSEDALAEVLKAQEVRRRA